jgi:hypothetical protein
MMFLIITPPPPPRRQVCQYHCLYQYGGAILLQKVFGTGHHTTARPKWSSPQGEVLANCDVALFDAIHAW